jgi:mono/diheme cytochrome c family protein
VADLSALPEHRNDDFAFRFAGEIEVPSSGEWTFWTASDDGSRLWIDGELLVNNDGIHGVKEVSAKTHLEAGLHSLEVRMFERAGGEELKVQWQGPNQERGPLSADVLSHSSLALAPQPASFETHPEADRIGANYFSKMRCYACHESGVTPKDRAPLKGVADLDVASSRGCLGEELNPQVPLYDITNEEITALYFAIDAIQRGETVTPSTSSQMQALRCTACHQRDGVGGPTAPRSAWFNVLDHADLGDEGRIPPTLEGVGAKLRGDWLRSVLLEGGTARPYMETRMPQYQHELVEPLAAAFLEEDWDGSSDELTDIDVEEIAFGQRLVGTGGLGCINCHTFAGHDSLGIPATDMSAMYTRLNQGWFHKLLFDPVALKMNTRMPDFWLNGESPVKDIHGGDIHKQIDAIWSYLSLGDAAPYPKGLIHSANEFELTPTDAPIHAGVFMRDMSPRVLVVGTPERIHYAFDIEHSRLGRAWAGVFFDAAGTWNGRAGGLEVPPVPWIDFAPGAPFAVLSDAAASWPGEMGRKAGYRGLGRTMDEADMPTFRYSLGDVVVAEKPQPELRLGGARLVRAFSITGSASSGGSLYLRASAGSLTEGDGEWLRGGEVTLSVSGDGRAFLRGEGDSAELLVEINQLPANIEVTYTW